MSPEITTALQYQGFLTQYPPFDQLDTAVLESLLRASSVSEVGPGTEILDGLSHSDDWLFVVLSGSVQLWSAGAIDTDAPDELVEPGGVFGYVAVLFGSRHGPRAVAETETALLRCPGEVARPLFATPAGSEYLAAQVAAVWPRARRRLQSRPAEQPVVEILRPGGLTVPPGTSIAETAQRMREARSRYAIIADQAGPQGIVTDTNFTRRVVATGRDVNERIDSVMTAPLYSVVGTEKIGDVLLEMLDRRLSHMPVFGDDGALLGVLSERDFLEGRAIPGALLVDRIESSPPDEIPLWGTKIRETTERQFARRATTRQISGTASIAVEALVGRIIELELASSERAAEYAAAGLTANSFTWLCLGSISRREAMPASDVDSAIVLADDPAESAAALERRRAAAMALAVAVHQRLEIATWPYDRNGAVAARARFTRTAREWRQAAADWIAHPLTDQALMMASLVVDGRAVWGDATLSAPAAAFRELPHHRHAMRLMLREALATRAHTRSLRDTLSLRGGTIDIKAHAITPVVNMARWVALSVGSTEVQTRNRLAIGAASPLMPDDTAAVLAEVFDVLQHIQLEHQLQQLNDGRQPGNVIEVKRLPPLARALFGQAVREVGAAQRRMANLSQYLDTDEWL